MKFKKNMEILFWQFFGWNRFHGWKYHWDPFKKSHVDPSWKLCMSHYAYVYHMVLSMLYPHNWCYRWTSSRRQLCKTFWFIKNEFIRPPSFPLPLLPLKQWIKLLTPSKWYKNCIYHKKYSEKLFSRNTKKISEN